MNVQPHAQSRPIRSPPARRLNAVPFRFEDRRRVAQKGIGFIQREGDFTGNRSIGVSSQRGEVAGRPNQIRTKLLACLIDRLR